MRLSIAITLSTILCCISGHAQSIRFIIEDEVSKNMVTYDSVAIVRERDSARIVTRGSSVNFSTVGVDERTSTEPHIRIAGNEIHCTGFTGHVRCVLTDVIGGTLDLSTTESETGSTAHLPGDVNGWHGLTATDGRTTLRCVIDLHDNIAMIAHGVGKNGTIADKEWFFAVIYIGNFTSIKQHFSYDPASNSLQHIYVERPLWMSRVIAVDVFASRYPTDTTYHRDLYQNKLRTNQTYIWSFAKDSATYKIDPSDNSPYGSLTYVLGDERKAARVIHYDWGAIGRGYDVFDVTMKERPVFTGNKVIISCSSSQVISRYWQELDGNNQIYQESDFSCNGRCIVFTLK